MRGDLVAEAAADVLRDHAELVDPDPHGRRHHDHREPRELIVGVHRPLSGAAVVLGQRAAELDRRRVEAVEVQLLDADDMIGLGKGGVDVPPLPHAGVGHVRLDLVVEQRRPVVQGLPCVDDDVERLVLDHDELGGVACALARVGDHGGDGLTDEPCATHRERVVLHVPAGRRRDLEERVRLQRDLVPGQRAVHAGQLERGRDVDGCDLGVRIRRPDEVDEAHVVPLDVVEEDPLALHQPAILLARHALADEALLEGGRLGGLDGGHAVSPPATLCTASTMFQYPVQRQRFPCSAILTSFSLGLGFAASSAAALISIPGVQ